MAAVSIENYPIPANGAIHVMAPHPDDFDAIAVMLFFLASCNRSVYLSVLTGGENGVTDGFDGAATDAEKRLLRQREQLASCQFFGLDPTHIHFPVLQKTAAGFFSVTAVNQKLVMEELRWSDAGVIVLPHGNDTNRTHQFCAELLQQTCEALNWKGEIWFNRDEKTIAMRDDLFIAFDQAKAEWKAELLRLHCSQQYRNQLTRGHGFDERVLQMNAKTAELLGLLRVPRVASTDRIYAESFEVQRFS